MPVCSRTEADDHDPLPEEREAARRRVAAKRDLLSHVVAYVVINGFLVAAWAVTGAGYLWPAWVVGGWGVGVVFHAWGLFARRAVTEEDVDAEMTAGAVNTMSRGLKAAPRWWGRGRVGRRVAAAVTVSVAALALGACGGADSAPKASAPSTSTTVAGRPGVGLAQQLQEAFISAVNRIRPSVVEIATASGLGSGVVYDTNGDIVTNAHVVGDAQQFQVSLADGRSLAGVLVGTYPPDDLAVVRITGPNLPAPATFGDSASVAVGEIVLAVGNPLGLSSSVTDGIVSFNRRTVGEGNGVVLPATIQTSAPINPGNSGGALIDLDARVIGIPTLVAGDAQSGTAAAGIGFAIPANTVKLIASQLVSSGRVTNTGRAALGIRGASALSPSGAPVGVVVVTVTMGGAADQAGIRPGDLVSSVEGHDVTSLAGLADVMARLRPGSTVAVTIERSGVNSTLRVTLEQLTAS